MAEGTPDTIAGRDQMRPRIRFRLPAGAPQPPDWGQAALADGSFELSVDDPTTVLHRMTGWALDDGVPFEAIEVTRPSLEDVYLELTGAEVEAE